MKKRRRASQTIIICLTVAKHNRENFIKILEKYAIDFSVNDNYWADYVLFTGISVWQNSLKIGYTAHEQNIELFFPDPDSPEIAKLISEVKY